MSNESEPYKRSNKQTDGAAQVSDELASDAAFQKLKEEAIRKAKEKYFDLTPDERFTREREALRKRLSK